MHTSLKNEEKLVGVKASEGWSRDGGTTPHPAVLDSHSYTTSKPTSIFYIIVPGNGATKAHHPAKLQQRPLVINLEQRRWWGSQRYLQRSAKGVGSNPSSFTGVSSSPWLCTIRLGKLFLHSCSSVFIPKAEPSTEKWIYTTVRRTAVFRDDMWARNIFLISK